MKVHKLTAKSGAGSFKKGSLSKRIQSNVAEIHQIDRGWKKYLHKEWLDGLDSTEFMTKCRTGKITKQELNSYVCQQFQYSRHFTRYLAALLANVVDEKHRRELVENLFEEMGLGDFGAKPHSIIYREMMKSMGVTADDEAINDATKNLVNTMLELCNNRSMMVGLGALCLAAEAIVPHMYSTIVAGFKNVGEPVKNLEFYNIHIEGDDEHAVTMRKIIEVELAKDPSLIHDLNYGARKAIAARVEFFKEISENHNRNKRSKPRAA